MKNLNPKKGLQKGMAQTSRFSHQISGTCLRQSFWKEMEQWWSSFENEAGGEIINLVEFGYEGSLDRVALGKRLEDTFTQEFQLMENVVVVESGNEKVSSFGTGIRVVNEQRVKEQEKQVIRSQSYRLVPYFRRDPWNLRWFYRISQAYAAQHMG